MVHDVIVVGGSYAGMAAALQVARARRKVLVIDAGVRRNRFATHAHGFLGQDGVDPATIAAQARSQLLAYPNLSWVEGTVVDAVAAGAEFALTTGDGRAFAARRLVLALGVTDVLPGVPGLAERWGRFVFHCPYCHGYELDGGSIGVLATGPASMHQALLLPDWGPTTLLLDGTFVQNEGQRAELQARGVSVEATKVTGISGEADVELADGRVLRFAGLFTAPRTYPSGDIASRLGCALDDGPLGPYLRTGPRKDTTVPGVFACGDIARPAGSVSIAVGDGAMAGTAAHQSLIAAP
jgi:thioredoxin reductase